MKLSALTSLAVGTLAVVGHAPRAEAGGLFLPGSGAVSTSRAGAAVASTSDGEALGVNPAGLAKSKGTTITLSMAIISYAMEFTRRGTYDPIAEEALPYENQAYPTVRNDPDLAMGIGSFQPVPVFAVVSDLGGRVPNLTVAAGLYAPNAYPFRDLCTETSSGCRKYSFNGDFNAPPPPTRYDIISQEALILLPSLAAAYAITPELDVGARFSTGFAHLKSKLAIWGNLDNFDEFVKEDATFAVDVKDRFVPGWGLGATYRPTPMIELAASYNSQLSVGASGDATAVQGPNVSLSGNPIVILPVDDAGARCATGGTRAHQKVCAEIAVPMTATIGGRYKFVDGSGKERGDIELDLGWENWGAERASNYRIVVDAEIHLINASGDEVYAASLRDSFVDHRLEDTYSARLGGSYNFPAGSDEVIVRGGLGYDTRAAKEGWLRADIDGAARTTLTVGGGYRAPRWELNIGGGAVLEGTNDNPGSCNPTGRAPGEQFGCGPGNTERPIEERSGPDPLNPVLLPTNQAENPVSQGIYKSHYLMFMLGFSTWF